MFLLVKYDITELYCTLKAVILWLYSIISYVHSTFIIQNGFSPLYVASQEGHTDVVDILLRKGADVNQTTTDEVCATYNKRLCLSVPIMH